MKYFSFSKITLIVFLFIGGNAQGLFAQSSKTIDVKNFTAISVSDGIDAYLTQGSVESVVIKGPDELLEKVEVNKEDRLLIIKHKNEEPFLFSKNQIKAYVTLQTLTSVEAKGSGVITQNNIITNKLHINANEGSAIDLDLKCDELGLFTLGGGNIKLKGSCLNRMSIQDFGNSVIDLEVKCDYLELITHGNSDIKLKVNAKNMYINAQRGSIIDWRSKCEDLTLSVDDNCNVKLKGGCRNMFFQSSGNSNVNMDFGDLKLKTNGKSQINLKECCRNMAVESNGNDDIDLELKCDELKLKAYGGGDIKLKGSCRKMFVDASDSSDIDGYDFVTEIAEVVASSGSNAKINVTKLLNAKTLSNGGITYKGAATLKTATAGNKNVKHIN